MPVAQGPRHSKTKFSPRVRMRSWRAGTYPGVKAVSLVTKRGPLKARTQSDIAMHSRRSFADFLDTPVTGITRDACAKRFAELSKRGPTTANQAFRYLRSVLSYVSHRHWEDNEPLLRHNPVNVLKYS
jgi:hypothetical protein